MLKAAKGPVVKSSVFLEKSRRNWMVGGFESGPDYFIGDCAADQDDWDGGLKMQN
jgi:hypothetical protein